MSLSGEQFEAFMNALIAAYVPSTFTQMLRLRLNKRLDLIAGDGNFAYQVYQVIDAAEHEGWTFKLLVAARSYNPGNPELLAFANQFGLVATETPKNKAALESIIQKSNGFLDASVFRALQGWVETAVCRVKVDGSPIGTGFLVGPGAVMTNHHVVAAVINGDVAPSTVRCQFDYKRLNSGQPISEGVEYSLADGDGWLVAALPPTLEELAGEPKTVLPSKSELDFALLRLEKDIAGVKLGLDMPASLGTTAATPRAWLPLNTGHALAPYDPLWIMQHPDAGPLQLALDTKAVIDVNSNETRITYKTNTQKGSSGSPVFDQNWVLVALHHSGDLKCTNPTANEGVPITSIYYYLKSQSLLQVLDKQES